MSLDQTCQLGIGGGDFPALIGKPGERPPFFERDALRADDKAAKEAVELGQYHRLLACLGKQLV
jgi:hypothetical protein